MFYENTDDRRSTASVGPECTSAAHHCDRTMTKVSTLRVVDESEFSVRTYNFWNILGEVRQDRSFG